MDENDIFARVSIFGHEYTVKAPTDSSYIKNIAEYVDAKMREVQEGMPNVQSTERIAILAAMNISDELFTNRKEKENFSSEMENKVQSLIEIVDKNL